MRVTYCNRTDSTFRGLSHVEFLLITKHVLTVVLEQTTLDVKEVSRTKYIPSTFQFIFSKNWKIGCICNTCGSFLSPHTRGIRLWNPLSEKLLLVESGIPLSIGIQNLSSTEKYWNPVPGIRNPRLCSISLYGQFLIRP